MQNGLRLPHCQLNQWHLHLNKLNSFKRTIEATEAIFPTVINPHLICTTFCRFGRGAKILEQKKKRGMYVLPIDNHIQILSIEDGQLLSLGCKLLQCTHNRTLNKASAASSQSVFGQSGINKYGI